MRNKKLHLVIGGIVLSIFLNIFTNISTTNVSAASSADSIYKKTLLNAIKTCYNDTYMKKSVLGTDYSGPYSLMAGSQNWISTGTGSGGFKDGVIKVPSQYGNSLDDADMSCYQLFSGWREDKSTNSAKGLLKLYGKTIPENKLPSIGYEKQEVSANGGYKQGCVSFKYTAPNGSGGSATYETNQLCMDVGSDNKIDVYTNTPTVGDSKGGKISIFMDANYVVNIYGPDGMFATTPHSLMAGGGEAWDTFKSEFETAAKQIDGWVNMATSNSYGFHFNSVNASLGNEDHYSEYTRTQSGDTAATKALRYFAGSGKTWDSIKFNDEDRYTLYTAYIERYIKDSNYPSVYIGADSKCSNKLSDAKKETGYAYRKDKTTWCPLYGVENGNVPKLNGIASGNTKLTPMDFKDIVNEMMKTKYDTYAAAEGTNNIGSADPGDDDGGEGEDASPCSKAGQSLGWIICPVVQLVSEATQGIYGYIESSYLQTNPDFISDDGTREAWGSFRSYANIIFVIVLSIIILSQITGFGVTNYGIKKMLPTVIMMAVLVNISFFLCEVAVDLSNIVGYGAGKLFNGIEAGSADTGITLGGMTHGLAMTFLTGAGTVGGLALAYNTIEFWIIPFLLMLLVAFISVVMFFIILGVRQAGIIILVTLAPVAIICYALPNTKKLFERWWKLFFSLLLVYPICGILMSGGQFASKLLLNVGTSSDDGMKFSYAFVAILLQAVPFFFIPSILKSSMAAMGNLGTKLSNFGRGLGKVSTGTIRKSEGYKDLQARLGGRNAERQLRRMDNNRGLGNRINNRLRQGNGRLSRMAQNSYNRRQNRLQGAALAQSLANRDRSGAFTQRHVAELAKDYTDTWENDGTFAEESSAAAQLESALNDLRADHENVDARARFTSAMHNLNASDAGRQYVDSVLNGGVRAAALAGQTSNQGIQWAASAVRNAAGGEYKAKNPTTFKNLNKLASGSYAYNANDIISTTDKDGHEFLANKNYLNDKARDIGAEQLMNTDDMYRRNAIQGLQDGTITGDERNNLIAQAREVMNNPNLTPKGDVARDMDAIANMDYAPPTGSASSNSSASTVDGGSVRRMASASQTELDRIVRGVENGTIGTNNIHTGANDRAEIANVAEATLNAANAGTVNLSQETADKLNRIRALDGRAEIPYSLRVQHGNSAPVPSGFEENGSGIVIPRNGQNGDMTGSQIRDFERQMRQHNNGGNGGRNNNNGGGIILP